jgi:hypothetical protein
MIPKDSTQQRIFTYNDNPSHLMYSIRARPHWHVEYEDSSSSQRRDDSDQVAAARAEQSGGRARIPNARIVPGMQVNAGWSWHLEDVIFAESTIELCDGRPSDVERQGTGFGGGRFCPWTATVIRIEEN